MLGGQGRRADRTVTWWAKLVLASQIASGSLQNCSYVSSGHASCPGLLRASTEAAAPALGCPILPARPAQLAGASIASRLLSCLCLAPLLSPGFCASPASVNNAPFMLQPPEFFHSVCNALSQFLPPFHLIIFKCFIPQPTPLPLLQDQGT